MTETIAFEDRIAEQLRAYAGPAARPPRREAVADAVEAARNVHGGIRGGLRWPRLGRPSMAFAAGAAVVVLAVVGVVFLGSLPNQPRLGGPAVTPTVTPIPTADPRSPGPTAQPSISGSMWPQSSIEEVRQAQERADAGDPDYTWQVDPQLVGGPTDGWDAHVIETGVQVTERFLRDELGWDAFMFNPEQGFGDDGGIDGIIRNLVYLRCAPAEANSLYPIAGDEGASGAERCAPTIDDLRYETVSIDLSQPVRRGADGIWVVNRWNIATPFAQADPEVVQAEAEARLEEFLQARVDGEGAEGYVYGEVPLLYATTTGAPYESFEIERVGGPQWPRGNLEFEVRLFAEDGATVVEQKVSADGGAMGLDGMLTTENGRPVPQPFVFMDGKLTVLAPHPWDFGVLSDHGHTALDYDENYEERIEFVDDPLTVGTSCESGQSAANATALADAIRSDPDFVTTAPVTVTIAGQQGLGMDITAAPGASVCADGGVPQVLTKNEDGADFHGVTLHEGGRMRLYLLDAPEGSSIGTLAIAVMAPESRFDAVVADATPIIESMEFHTP